MPTKKINLLDLDRDRMHAFMESLGEKAFHADQICKWIHQSGCTDFTLMTNLSKTLRQKLTEYASISPLEQVSEECANDGTRKWLLRLLDGNCIETVYIPEPGRGTLCVSSQIGCALNCTFCATGSMGFNRNLSFAEIIGQVWHVVQTLARQGDGEKVTNVVMMGMGEPLLNYKPVVAAMDLMMDDLAYGLSKYRVTLSTSGVVPAIVQLKQDSDCALAVSLHAPTDGLRNILVPINKKYNLAQLMDVCRTYFSSTGRRRITFEYVMLHEVNDSVNDARVLIKLLAGVPAKVNLIPFNPFPHARYTCSKVTVIENFKQCLTHAGIITLLRKTRGDDINAACGQLVGDFKDRTKRSARIAAQNAVTLGQSKQLKQGVGYATAVQSGQRD